MQKICKKFIFDKKIMKNDFTLSFNVEVIF